MTSLVNARSERGQTSVEYLGGIVLVGIILAVVLSSSVGATIARGLDEAICAIADLGCSSIETGSNPNTTNPDAAADAAPDIDEGRVADVTQQLKMLLDPSHFGGLGPSPVNADTLAGLLSGLSPAELDAVLANLSDDELGRMIGAACCDLWSDGQEFFDLLAERASPETLRRIEDLTGIDAWNPPFDDVGSDSRDEFSYEELLGSLFVDADGDGTAIHPSDIDQGGLGDCYFLAALAELAEEAPHLIENMIDVNPNGSFTVTFYDGDGDPVEVVVTPDFVTEDGMPVFAGSEQYSSQEELWPLILEKAYAKYHDSFGGIEGGHSSDAWETLTGNDSEDFDVDDVDSIEDLDAYENSGDAMTFDTPGESDAPLFEDGTLAHNHVYFVRDIDPVTGMITLGNPWSWSDDGIQITFEQFQEHFEEVDINDLGD